MEKSTKYTVAGHTFEVILPEGIDADECLKPYLPFACDDESLPLFTLRMDVIDNLADTKPGVVKECLNDEAPYFWIFDDEGKYNFGFSYGKSHPDCILKASDDFRDSVVYVPASMASRLAEFALSNAMMLLYTFCTSPYETLMVHASVIRHGGAGFMFLGKSGTGKSTHSRLWLEHIDDTELLNDDNPVIRLVDGEPYVFGTPWSGKTPCYKNENVPLKAVVRLSQAPYNKINRLNLLQSYASLMPACSCMRWDRSSVDSLHKTVEKVISKVKCWSLECLPDGDAARTCHSAVVR